MHYIDDYSTCDETYATLRIYPVDATHFEVSKILGLQPTKFSAINKEKPNNVNGWFLSSKGHVDSKDSRRHIDWLLDQIETVQTDFMKLTKFEAKADISCYWVSSAGHGGPIISPYQMARLVSLNLDVSWDVYI